MNKKAVLAFFATVALLSFAYGQSRSDVINNFVKSFIFGNQDNWAISLDNTKIGLSEFQNGYKFFMKQIPEEQRKAMPDEATLKKQYFKDALMQYVVVLKAVGENVFSDEENQVLLNAALKQAVMQIYIKKYLPANKDAFKPSTAEINDFYEKNKAQFPANTPVDQIKAYITQQIGAQKMQLWLQDFLDKTKENFKVQRNNSVLTSAGFN